MPTIKHHSVCFPPSIDWGQRVGKVLPAGSRWIEHSPRLITPSGPRLRARMPASPSKSLINLIVKYSFVRTASGDGSMERRCQGWQRIGVGKMPRRCQNSGTGAAQLVLRPFYGTLADYVLIESYTLNQVRSVEDFECELAGLVEWVSHRYVRIKSRSLKTQPAETPSHFIRLPETPSLQCVLCPKYGGGNNPYGMTAHGTNRMQKRAAKPEKGP